MSQDGVLLEVPLNPGSPTYQDQAYSFVPTFCHPFPAAFVEPAIIRASGKQEATYGRPTLPAFGKEIVQPIGSGRPAGCFNVRLPTHS